AGASAPSSAFSPGANESAASCHPYSHSSLSCILVILLVSHKFTHVSHGGVDRRESGAKTEALTTFRSSGSGSFGAPVACGTILVAINGIVTHDATWWKFCTSS